MWEEILTFLLTLIYMKIYSLIFVDIIKHLGTVDVKRTVYGIVICSHIVVACHVLK